MGQETKNMEIHIGHHTPARSLTNRRIYFKSEQPQQARAMNVQEGRDKDRWLCES